MKKHLSILTVVFVILAVAVFLVSRPKKLGDSSLERPLLKFKMSEVDSFEIDNFIVGFLFQKTSDGWGVKRVHNALAKSVKEKDETSPVEPEDAEFKPADPVKVAELLSTLSTVKIGESIATKKETAKLFEINEHSLHVLFFDRGGNTLMRLDVGKVAPDFMSTYVRLGHGDEVYLAGQNLRGLLLYSYEEWLSKADHGEDEKNNQQKTEPEKVEH